MNDECIFCKKVAQKYSLIENEYFITTYDKYPVSKGHTLIISKRHVASFFDLSKQEKESLDQAIMETKHHLDDLFKPSGYNIGVNINECAGQTVMHVHIHVIPRYKDDILDPRGGVRGVIPEKQKY